MKLLSLPPLELTSDYKLLICGTEAKASFRYFKDLAPVLMDPSCLGKLGGRVAYYMYRNVCRPEDEELFEECGLRYDVTVIPPAKVGEEFVKTFGHYHPPTEEGASYAEVYEVLSGEAYYLLQKPSNEDIEEFVLVYAPKGATVVIPPDYGHVTVNPSEETLVMCNLVSSEFSSRYEKYKELRGAAYYLLTNGELRRNEMYPTVKKLRFLRARPIFANIYETFLNDPELFRFLEKPSLYVKLPEWLRLV